MKTYKQLKEFLDDRSRRGGDDPEDREFGLQNENNVKLAVQALLDNGWTESNNKDAYDHLPMKKYVRTYNFGFHYFIFRNNSEMERAAKVVSEAIDLSLEDDWE